VGDKTAKKFLREVCHFKLFKIFKKKWQKRANLQVNSRGILFFEGAVMKNIISAVGFFLEGAARIFDFAGVMNEENLHETQDAAAINKDWRAVGGDYNNSNKIISEELNGLKKKRNGKSKR
jgi:hypothetical protein